MKKLAEPVLAILIASFTCIALVGAFHSGGASAEVPVLVADAGSDASDEAPATRAPAELVAATTTPAADAKVPVDELDDPLENPAAAIDDLKAAKRTGWVIFVFAIVTMVARVLGKLGKRKELPWLAWLNRGKTAIGIGLVSSLGAAGYNALADGGSYYALAAALVMGFATFWDAHGDEKPEAA